MNILDHTCLTTTKKDTTERETVNYREGEFASRIHQTGTLWGDASADASPHSVLQPRDYDLYRMHFAIRRAKEHTLSKNETSYQMTMFSLIL